MSDDDDESDGLDGAVMDEIQSRTAGLSHVAELSNDAPNVLNVINVDYLDNLDTADGMCRGATFCHPDLGLTRCCTFGS